jgi:hypothetical protein
MSLVRKVSKALPVCIFAACSLLSAATASAAVQQHSFTLSGSNGETGGGTFTWDDAVVPTGNYVALSDVISLSLTISGGNVVGGTSSFTKANCTDAALGNTPNFALDINFWCDNGSNSLFGVDPYTNDLNEGASTLTFTPGTTAPVAPTSIPTLSEWAMVILSSLLALGAILTLRRKRQ